MNQNYPVQSKRVLITGANGFIGKPLCVYLARSGFDIAPAVRSSSNVLGCPCYCVGNIDGSTCWREPLRGADTVIHLAARVHVSQDHALDSSDLFHDVNVAGTLNLMRQAIEAGVRRFIYLSSVKVNGDVTFVHPFTEGNRPDPEGAYGQSKLDAERDLWACAEHNDIELVIVRPPLTYGPEVKGNFLKLLWLMDKKIPLPFGTLQNKRSFLFLDNLLDFLRVCIDHPKASGEVFLISDDEDQVFSGFLRQIAGYMGYSPCLFPCPYPMLSVFGSLTGNKNEVKRLCNSLQIDISKAKELLGWHPPYSVDVGLNKTVTWFLDNA